MRNEERAAMRAGLAEEAEETTALGLPETEEKEFTFTFALKPVFANDIDFFEEYGRLKGLDSGS